MGYRDDLDRNLVQAYANTGVVHIIAISGMHLALIYGLLILVIRRLLQNRKTRWIRRRDYFGGTLALQPYGGWRAFRFKKRSHVLFHGHCAGHFQKGLHL